MTKTEARAAVRWFKKAMGIRDWEIRLWVSDNVPSWISLNDHAVAGLGRARSWPAAKLAYVWVGPNRCRDDGESPLWALFHELMHVLKTDIGLPEPTDAVEYAWDRLAGVCETAYLAETKGKRRKKR